MRSILSNNIPYDQLNGLDNASWPDVSSVGKQHTTQSATGIILILNHAKLSSKNTTQGFFTLPK